MPCPHPSWSHSLRQSLQVSLVMQYCSGGTLESAIHTDGPFSESRFQEPENAWKCKMPGENNRNPTKTIVIPKNIILRMLV